MRDWILAGQGALGVFVTAAGVALISVPAGVIVLGVVLFTSALAGAYVRGSDS